MTTIIKRELFSYFATMTGWVFLGLFVLTSAVYFLLINVLGLLPDYNVTLHNKTLMFMILIPALTMRFFAGEVRQSTDRLLFTLPISPAEIILGKFFGGVLLFLSALGITVIFPVILSFYGTLPVAQIAGTFIGFAFVGCSFIAVGLLISSLSNSQIISAIVTFCALLFLFLVDMYAGLMATSLRGLSVMSRFDNFARGILNISDIVYYITFSIALVLITVVVAEARRSRG